MFELIVIYNDGTRETTTYNTEDAAGKAQKNYYMAFGNQISYTYIRRAK